MVKKNETSAKAEFRPEIVLRDPVSLTPYFRNAKKHPTEQIDKIASSIAEFKFDQPIVIDEQGVIIKGHGRREAAIRLGLKEIPVIVRGDLSEIQKKAARIADNRVAESPWNDDLLKIELAELKLDSFDLPVLGFSESELGNLGINSGTDGETDPDDVPDSPPAVCKLGQKWQLGDHVLLCGDCTDSKIVDSLMGGLSADMVLTDPPYGVAYAEKNKFLNSISPGNRNQTPIENDHGDITQTADLWFRSFGIIKKILAPASCFYIFGPQGGDLAMMMMMMMEKSGLPLRHTLIWSKNNHVLGRMDYNYKHEPILYGWDKKHKFYGGGSQKFSIWNFDKPLKNDLHPTMKPVELLENAILNSSQKGEIVVDLFLGSGSTLIACEKTGRRCFGVEISPNYCDVIIKRWEDFTGRKAVLMEANG